ncbi:MAG: nicotinate phosphoribosyltransferase [bacterium]
MEKNSGLYTDYYQLTMAQGYYLAGFERTRSCFDYFFREIPFYGSYVLFAGLKDLLGMLQTFGFQQESLDYLKAQGFHQEFLNYLRSFHFGGTILSVREGELVFPLEPILRVEGSLIEAQLIESMLLNILNFESLIATKASRVRIAAGDRRIVDFGLRRGQGFGSVHASRAAIIGGVDATSNVFTAFEESVEVAGTQAHSWIQSFDDELTSFRKFAEIYPDKCVLLVDTYNTLKSGVPNAIIVAKELEARGYRMVGIRLDSGDLAYLSKHTRAMLDEASLGYVKIVVSNQLDENVIRSLLIEQQAPIDIFGVGTRLITGQPSAALDGVYKLSMSDGVPRLKFSENYGKLSLPGIKKVYRYKDGDGFFTADAIALDDESVPEFIHHPIYPEQQSRLDRFTAEQILVPVMENGKPVLTQTTLQSAEYARTRLAQIASEHKRFEHPHIYKVGISHNLLKLRTQLVDQFLKKMHARES